MTEIGKHSRALRLAAAAGAVLVLAVSAWAVIRVTGDQAGAEPSDSAAVAAGKPVSLTIEQCEAAAAIVEGMRSDRDRVAERIGSTGATAMDAQIAESTAWVVAGCPPDDVLGFYPDSSGKGGELRVFRQQTFGTNGVSGATMERTD